ncbi:MAG TPA: hypothetical protein V6C95_05945 [Coleofasciculaceae cyanobacterium]
MVQHAEIAIAQVIGGTELEYEDVFLCVAFVALTQSAVKHKGL